jgi:hypothetical protein
MRVQEKEKEVDYLAEVKPSSALAQPVLEGKKITTKKIHGYNNALKTWLINRAKFAAAKHFAESRGYRFIIVTEDFLFNK